MESLVVDVFPFCHLPRAFQQSSQTVKDRGAFRPVGAGDLWVLLVIGASTYEYILLVFNNCESAAIEAEIRMLHSFAFFFFLKYFWGYYLYPPARYDTTYNLIRDICEYLTKLGEVSDLKSRAQSSF